VNKTLLLIICDFLLLNLIHFTAWDKLEEDANKTPATGGPVEVGTGMGDPSRDVEFVTRKYKNIKADLENEQIKKAALQAEMKASENQSATNLAKAINNANAWKNVYDKSAKTNEVLEAATRELDRTKTIALAERDKERTLKDTITQEREELQQDNRDLTNQVSNLTQATNRLTATIGDLKLDLRRAGEGTAAERKRADLEAKRAQAERENRIKAEGVRDQAIAEAKSTRQNAGQQLTVANTRVVKAEAAVKDAQAEVKDAQAEVKTVTANAAEAEKELVVTKAKTAELAKDVVQEKTEKEIAQKAAQQLREDIAKKIPDQPINANMMATLYFQNQVELQLQAVRGFGRKKMASPTVLIEVMENGKPYVHAITHASDTPYRLIRNALAFRESSGSLMPRDSKPLALSAPPQHVRFLKDDPRVIIIPLGAADSPQVKELDVKPYKLATKPFKFSKAFIMSKTGRKFGTVEFKTDLGNRNYVKVDRIFFNFAGKFNPAKGDLVFSQTGELLGIMANNKYCLVIQKTIPAKGGFIMFGKNDSAKVAQILDDMRKIIAAKPFALQ
jgi:hypothetical protein